MDTMIITTLQCRLAVPQDLRGVLPMLGSWFHNCLSAFFFLNLGVPWQLREPELIINLQDLSSISHGSSGARTQQSLAPGSPENCLPLGTTDPLCRSAERQPRGMLYENEPLQPKAFEGEKIVCFISFLTSDSKHWYIRGWNKVYRRGTCVTLFKPLFP